MNFGWRETSYSEPAPYPVSMDTEGRHVIRYPNGQNGASYVVKTEIRHIAPPPIVTVAAKNKSSTNTGKDERDRPEKVEFLTRVPDETGQPIKAALPLSPWHAIRTVHDDTNKPIENTDVYKKKSSNGGKPPVVQAKFPPMQKEINPYPEIIDSTDTSWRHGKPYSWPRTETGHQRIIDSKQAVAMYNGVELPPEFPAVPRGFPATHLSV